MGLNQLKKQKESLEERAKKVHNKYLSESRKIKPSLIIGDNFYNFYDLLNSTSNNQPNDYFSELKDRMKKILEPFNEIIYLSQHKTSGYDYLEYRYKTVKGENLPNWDKSSIIKFVVPTLLNCHNEDVVVDGSRRDYNFGKNKRFILSGTPSWPGEGFELNGGQLPWQQQIIKDLISDNNVVDFYDVRSFESADKVIKDLEKEEMLTIYTPVGVTRFFDNGNSFVYLF